MIHSLSYYKIYKKWKMKKKKNTNLNYPKLQQGESCTTLCIFFFFRTPGGFYRYQGKGGQEDNPWPKAWARPRHVFAALLEPRAPRLLPHLPLSAGCPDFWFWASGFDESALQSQWLYYRPLIVKW